MEEELDVSSLKKSIDEIETVLRHSRNSTVDAVNAFESFSNSVEGVRKELDPIIVLTQKLMVSQRNINSTVSFLLHLLLLYHSADIPLLIINVGADDGIFEDPEPL